jgi:hypothetical protein
VLTAKSPVDQRSSAVANSSSVPTDCALSPCSGLSARVQQNGLGSRDPRLHRPTGRLEQELQPGAQVGRLVGWRDKARPASLLGWAPLPAGPELFWRVVCLLRLSCGHVLPRQANGRRTWIIPTLSPSMISQSRVIAKGHRIRDVERLAASNSGALPRWVKKSSPRLEDDEGL